MSLWVLVANSSLAEIFSVNGKEIKLVQRLENPSGRQKSGEILTDRPGRSFEGRGRGGAGSQGSRHALGTEIDVHLHEMQIFAHKLADILRKEKSLNSFDKLDIIAPPQFLGELRAILSDPIKKCISKEINKEIPATLSEHEKMDSIRKFLDLPMNVAARR